MFGAELPGKATGAYSPYLVLSSDIGVAHGREIHGQPKKLGQPRLEARGDLMVGTVERNGIDVITAHHALQAARRATPEAMKPYFDFATNLNLKAIDHIDGRPAIRQLTSRRLAEVTVHEGLDRPLHGGVARQRPASGVPPAGAWSRCRASTGAPISPSSPARSSTIIWRTPHDPLRRRHRLHLPRSGAGRSGSPRRRGRLCRPPVQDRRRGRPCRRRGRCGRGAVRALRTRGRPRGEARARPSSATASATTTSTSPPPGPPGLRVGYVPDYCTDEVADHTAAAALACCASLPPLDASVRRGEWAAVKIAKPMKPFAATTFGFFGLGQIGRAVLHRLKGFGFRFIAVGPRPDRRRCRDPWRHAGRCPTGCCAKPTSSRCTPRPPPTTTGFFNAARLAHDAAPCRDRERGPGTVDRRG